MITCPEETVLRSLDLDDLAAETFAEIEAHVEGCARCQATLEALVRPRYGERALPRNRNRRLEVPGFVVERELGRGAMGVVYRAVQAGLERPVALKVLANGIDGLAGDHARRRWLREARAVASVRHPHVVPLYDYGDVDGWLYLVLEYIPGGSLKDRLDGPIGARAAARLVETIARAVGHIHEQGLLHLDLKPSNILLDGRVDAAWDAVIPRVSDFGLAVFDGADVSEASLVDARGTPSYMAPEQTGGAGGEIGPAADVYAMGSLLYELLTGRPPFQGASTIETLEQVRGQEPVPPRRLNASVPRDLETICLKCLGKEPGRRYGSAEELARDLGCYLEGRTILARPVSGLERSVRWCRRRPVIAGLASALAVTVLTAFVSIVWLWRDANAARIRAQNDLQMTNELLGKMVEWSTSEPIPKTFDERTLVVYLEDLRIRILDLAAKRVDETSTSRALAFVDNRLGYALMQAGRWDDSRSVFEESVKAWERLGGRAPLDSGARIGQLNSLRGAGQVADRQGRWGESVAYFERTVRATEELVSVSGTMEAVNNLLTHRTSLAVALEHRGEHERARLLRMKNQRLLEEVADRFNEPELAAQRVFAAIDSGRHGGGLSVPGKFETGVHEAGGALALKRLVAPGASRLSSGVWAGLVIEALRSFDRGNDPHSFECQAVLSLTRHLTGVAGEQRHDGKLEEAQVTVDRMVALGRLVVERHAEQPAAHLVMSEAYYHLSKNAWQIPDRVAIERNLKLALDSAQRALAIDPGDEQARHLLQEKQRRLHRLMHPERDADAKPRG